MLHLYIAPLDKAGKPKHECEAKRPISLIRTLSKLLEAVVLNRLLPSLGPGFSAQQYAYRGGRGADMHLAEISDFTQEGIERGNPIYLTTLDTQGAFDYVPHQILLRNLRQMGVSGWCACR